MGGRRRFPHHLYMAALERAVLDTPVGPLTVAVEDGVLREIRFLNGAVGLAGRPLHVSQTLDRLRAYFDGDIAALDPIPAEPSGTPFQLRVWSMLRRIPAGRTWTYSELAHAIGRPDAVRAVGAANGANPIPIVIPCHRVIGADGRLVGYGGGLERKRWLLTHEGCRLL